MTITEDDDTTAESAIPAEVEGVEVLAEAEELDAEEGPRPGSLEYEPLEGAEEDEEVVARARARTTVPVAGTSCTPTPATRTR